MGPRLFAASWLAPFFILNTILIFISLFLSAFFFPLSAIAFAQDHQKFPYHLYFGETHNHTIFSFDYKGPEEDSEPIDAYKYAREKRGYDFFVISDHNFDRLDKELHRKGLEQAKQATEDGKFVAIYATEFNKGMKKQGHVNIFDPPVYIGWQDPDVYVEEGDIKGMYKAIEQNPGEFGPAAQFNHPYAVNFDEFEYDETGGRVMKLIETSNGKANFPAQAAETIEMYHENIQTALSRGWHLGFSASDDWHDHGWGTASPETTGLWAKALTKKEIIEAIKNRRSYGMDDENASALFLASGRIQGSIFNLPDGKIKFYVKIDDADPGEGVKKITFYYGIPGSNRKPEILKEMQGSVQKVNLFRFEYTQPPGTTYYYYPRVIQDDGDFIMISPVWITVPK